MLEAVLLAFGPGLQGPIFATVDFGSGARSEVRAGRAPVSSGQPSEPVLALLLIGLSTAEFASESNSLTLRYFPRFFVRYPNEFDLSRPLFLHSGDARHEYRATETLTWKSSFRGSAGEVDYTASELALASTSAAPVDVAVIQFLDLEGTTGLTQIIDPKTTGSATVLAGYNSPYDESTGIAEDGTTFLPYPAHTRLALELEAIHRSSERTAMMLPITGRYDTFSTGAKFVAVGAEFALRQRHGELTRSELRAGPVVVKGLDEAARDVKVYPRARAELVTGWARAEQQRFEQRAAVLLEPFLDPVRAEYRLLGGVELLTSLDLPPRWTASLELAGSTSVSRDPLEPPELETYVSARAPLRWRSSESSFFEFGARVSARGPHLADPPFEFSDLELWAYGAFAFVLGDASVRALY